ncbi:Protoporphyrinogen oxidase [Hypoxylon sp. FL1284]|nr:Protoporphyrinogen oxidase [Hypoxylon sp. FL1284]
MYIKRPEDVFIRLLRSAYRNPRHGAPQLTLLPVGTPLSRSASRPLSSLAARGTTSNSPTRRLETRQRTEKLPRARTQAFATAQPGHRRPREIAVLGGGITGLTAAHYLARHAEDAHITLYEASPRLGGWVEGKMMRVGDGVGDEVLVQRGPRILRPGGSSLKYDDLVFYDVVASLNLRDKLLSRASPGDRYIYYPDHLVRMPRREISLSNIYNVLTSVLTEPLWNGIAGTAWRLLPRLEPTSPSDFLEAINRPGLKDDFDRDVSVAEFLTEEQKVDPQLVDNVVSAVMHGIYGGDVHQLSAKSSILDQSVRSTRLPVQSGFVWVECKDMLLLRDMLESENRSSIIEIAERFIGQSAMMFEDGLVSLVDAMVADLQKRSNVTIRTSTPATSLARKHEQVSVSAKGSEKLYDDVICTLFSKQLAKLAAPAVSLSALAETEAVTLAVVNLFFPNPALLARNPGFGYLVPTTAQDNDECVLGVLFDSDIAPPRLSEPPGTKLTVMLGGHHWRGWPQLPTADMAREMAVDVARRHLGVDASEPVVAEAMLCRDCLPQHLVGHRDRMARAHRELLSAFGGRVAVAGPSYTAAGVVPSMRAAHDVALRVARGGRPPPYRADPVAVARHRLIPDARPAAAPPVPDDVAARAAAVVLRDHVGPTGLAAFADDELTALAHYQRAALPFRRWATPHYRYTDGRGNWLWTGGDGEGEGR